jgi:hypothetical protein
VFADDRTWEHREPLETTATATTDRSGEVADRLRDLGYME